MKHEFSPTILWYTHFTISPTFFYNLFPSLCSVNVQEKKKLLILKMMFQDHHKERGEGEKEKRYREKKNMDNREGAASYLHIWEKQSVIEPAEKIYCVEQGKFFFFNV